MLTATHKDGLYIVNRNVEQNRSLFSASNNDDTELWHRRFGLLNYHTLKSMKSHDIVNGIGKVNLKENNCVICLKNNISEEK